jgi:DNA invertase Pin-like site-specific DNA recombinase
MRLLSETVEDLQVRGIALRSLTESIDMATPGGRLVFHLFGALAEFERAVIRERTSAGLQAARDRGRKGANPRRSIPRNWPPPRRCCRPGDPRWRKSGIWEKI